MLKEEKTKPISVGKLARIAKVSPSTVSRALNNHPRVAPETRDMIMEIAKKHGYEPNHALGEFFSRASSGLKKNLALVSSYQYLLAPVQPYFNRMIAGIFNEADRQNFTLIIEYLKEDNGTGIPKCVASDKVDGVLAVSMKPDAINAFCSDIPTATLNFINYGGEKLDMILPNVEQAAYDQVHYLYNLGHRKIACFKAKWGSWQDRRYLTAYEECCENLKIRLPEAYLVPGRKFGYNEHDGAITEFLDRVLNCDQPPTAILTYDMYAASIISQLTHFGLHVPKDISIVGYDDYSYDFPSPIPLTTYRNDFDQMGKLAVRYLLERVRNKELSKRKIEVPGRLIVRQSSGPPPGKR